MKQNPTIKISKELKKKLESYGTKGDSFDKIIKTIMSHRETLHQSCVMKEREIDELKKRMINNGRKMP